MRMLVYQFLIFCTFLFTTSCQYKVVPLKGAYSNGNFEAYSEKSKEQVWDNIIDFFAKNGISIRIIDKSSGLIISGSTRLSWTYEDKNGKPANSSSWVVIQKLIDPGSKKPVNPLGIYGEWNIRIKEQNGKTLVNVNLVNPSYTYFLGGEKSQSFKKGAYQSSEIFEKWIYEQIK